MLDSKEKFTIKVTEKGVNLISSEGQEMRFTASEALMLLDILKNEEENLKVSRSRSKIFPARALNS